MPMHFDATIKDLAQDDPAAFVGAIDGPPTGPVALLNVDLSTVTAAADLVFGIGEPLAEVVHVETLSRAQDGAGAAVLRYNALLHHRLRVPVYSVVILLHPRARHPTLTGMVQYGGPATRGSTDFHYKVVNLWDIPVAELLKWPPNLLPLAALGKLPAGIEPRDALASVVGNILSRLHGEVEEGRFRRLATAAFVLTGMKVSPDEAKSMFLGVQGMQDSSTYQAILDEGRVLGSQKTLFLLGRKRFGEPDESTRQVLMAINDPDRLDWLSERLLDVGSWQELLSP